MPILSQDFSDGASEGYLMAAQALAASIRATDSGLDLVVMVDGEVESEQMTALTASFTRVIKVPSIANTMFNPNMIDRLPFTTHSLEKWRAKYPENYQSNL